LYKTQHLFPSPSRRATPAIGASERMVILCENGCFFIRCNFQSISQLVKIGDKLCKMLMIMRFEEWISICCLAFFTGKREREKLYLIKFNERATIKK
jgi:hypothetical protein